MTNSVTDALVEKAAKVMADSLGVPVSRSWLDSTIRSVLTAIAPDLIAAGRRQGLEEAATEARRYAGFYKDGSDGRNTFILLAEWAEAQGRGEVNECVSGYQRSLSRHVRRLGD